MDHKTRFKIKALASIFISYLLLIILYNQRYFYSNKIEIKIPLEDFLNANRYIVIGTMIAFRDYEKLPKMIRKNRLYSNATLFIDETLLKIAEMTSDVRQVLGTDPNETMLLLRLIKCMVFCAINNLRFQAGDFEEILLRLYNVPFETSKKHLVSKFTSIFARELFIELRENRESFAARIMGYKAAKEAYRRYMRLPDDTQPIKEEASAKSMDETKIRFK